MATEQKICTNCSKEFSYEVPPASWRNVGWMQHIVCDSCRKEEIDRSIEEERLRTIQRARELRLKRSGLPPKMQKMTFSTYKGSLDDPALERATTLAETECCYGEWPEEESEWDKKWDEVNAKWNAKGRQRGLYIFGEPGVGKTHLASAIANSFIDGDRITRFTLLADLLQEIRDSYDHERQTLPGETELIDRLVRAELVVLDDLGSEKPTEWAKQILFRIINGLWIAEHEPILVVTSNYSLQELEDRLGDGRIPSRIADLCQVVKKGGNDYRLRK